MVKIRVAVFRWSGGGWQRDSIRMVNSSELKQVNKKRGLVAYKRIPKDSLRFPAKPAWKPKKGMI